MRARRLLRHVTFSRLVGAAWMVLSSAAWAVTRDMAPALRASNDVGTAQLFPRLALAPLPVAAAGGLFLLLGLPGKRLVSVMLGASTLAWIVFNAHDPRVELPPVLMAMAAVIVVVSTASTAAGLYVERPLRAWGLLAGGVLLGLGTWRVATRPSDEALVARCAVETCSQREAEILMARGDAAVPAMLAFVDAHGRTSPRLALVFLHRVVDVGGVAGADAVGRLLAPDVPLETRRQALAVLRIDAALARTHDLPGLLALLPLLTSPDRQRAISHIASMPIDDETVGVVLRYLRSTEPGDQDAGTREALKARLIEDGSRPAWAALAAAGTGVDLASLAWAKNPTKAASTFVDLATGRLTVNGDDAGARRRATLWLRLGAMSDLGRWPALLPVLREVDAETLADPVAESQRLVETIRATPDVPADDASALLDGITSACMRLDTRESWDVVAEVWSMGIRPMSMEPRSTRIVLAASRPHRFLALFLRAKQNGRREVREALAATVLTQHGPGPRFSTARDDDQRLGRVLSSRPPEWVAVRDELAEVISWRRRTSEDR